MNSIDFCYWLQGTFEVAELEELNKKQVSIVKNHLNLVFKHEIDGMYEKEKLQAVHDGKVITTHTPISFVPLNDPLMRC